MSAEFEELPVFEEEDQGWRRAECRTLEFVHPSRSPVVRGLAASAVVACILAAVTAVILFRDGSHQMPFAQKRDLSRPLQASLNKQASDDPMLRKAKRLNDKATVAAAQLVQESNKAAKFFEEAAEAERAQAKIAQMEERAVTKGNEARAGGNPEEWVHQIQRHLEFEKERKPLSVAAWKAAQKARFEDALRVRASKGDIATLEEVVKIAHNSSFWEDDSKRAASLGARVALAEKMKEQEQAMQDMHGGHEESHSHEHRSDANKSEDMHVKQEASHSHENHSDANKSEDPHSNGGQASAPIGSAGTAKGAAQLKRNGFDVEVVRKLLLQCKHCHG